MKKYLVWVMLLTTLLLFGCQSETNSSSVLTNTDISSTLSSEDKGLKAAYMSLLTSLYEKDPAKITNEFLIRDVDNNGVEDLIFKHAGREITIYTFNHGKVTKIGNYDFAVGTLQLLYSDNPSYPGIIYFFVSGGLEQYGYITIKDNQLSIEKLWDEDFSESYQDRERIVEYSTDKQLIEESRNAYQKRKVIKFTPLESIM